MFIQTEKGLEGGRYDIGCILHNTVTNRFHVALFEEKPFIGSFEENEQRSFIRLRSKMHHTAGADTLDEANTHLEKMLSKVALSKNNVWEEPQPWDGDVGIIWMIPKYKFH